MTTKLSNKNIELSLCYEENKNRKNNMKNILVTGNGFNLTFNLKTQYKDFINEMVKSKEFENTEKIFEECGYNHVVNTGICVNKNIVNKYIELFDVDHNTKQHK